MIFGNWRPTGVALGAGLFGFADALRLRDQSSVHALLLVVVVAAAIGGVWMFVRRRPTAGVLLLAVAAGFGFWYATSDSVPREFLSFTPHITTLLVLAFATQRLRPPAAEGVPYRKGEAT
jgi:general nucleoside transport system permease protein